MEGDDDTPQSVNEQPSIPEWDSTRGVSQRNRGQVQVDGDAAEPDGVGSRADVPLEGLTYDNLLPADEIARAQVEVTQGKLPPPMMLQAYDEVVPGAAEAMVRAYIDGEEAANEVARAHSWALRKTAGSESYGVRVGASLGIAAMAVAGGGVVASAMGAPVNVLLLSLIPAVLQGASGLIIASRRRRQDDA